MRRAAPALLVVALAACATAPKPVPVYTPAPGINQVLEGKITAAPGHTLMIGDLNMGPGEAIPRHYHYGEEYIYVVGGSATVSRAGMPDVTLGPGQGVTVPPGLVHWGKAGAEGLRSFNAWVKDDGKPLREAVPD